MNENINEILLAREKKHYFIHSELASSNTVIVLSINYPGPNKCNRYSLYVFEESMDKLNDFLKSKPHKIIESFAGYYAIYSLDAESVPLKKKTIEIEETWKFGRLIDIDVYDSKLGLINRDKLKANNRKCFLCNNDAKICGRNRTHSVEELISYFNKVVEEDLKMNNNNEVLTLHEENTGLLEIKSLYHIKTKEDLAKAYTPGISQICKAIAEDEKIADTATIKGKMVAVISDGSAVLGLGNIGSKASLPVIEGKSLLYKELANVNAIPICIKQGTVNEMCDTILSISGSFSAIHLEDFKAPECFELEEKLQSMSDIVVYHDDQHGTAIALLAALINACKLNNKKFADIKVVMCGVGASGLASAKLLYEAGIKNITLVDKQGIINSFNASNSYQKEFAEIVNKNNISGSLQDALKEADVFVGLSEANVLNANDVKIMVDKPIIFALANPVPEIDPILAKQNGAYIVGTGSSKYPNQINNVLAFPGLFKGLLQRKDIKKVTNDLQIQIAEALANLSNTLDEEHIIADVFDERVVPTIENVVLNYQK